MRSYAAMQFSSTWHRAGTARRTVKNLEAFLQQFVALATTWGVNVVFSSAVMMIYVSHVYYLRNTGTLRTDHAQVLGTV